MIIYGAGMAGLLTANMLRRYQPVIHEVQPSLPNNHEALLRFRTDAVSRATGIPFRRVEVTKAIHYQNQLLSQPTIETNNLYSFKVTDAYRAHSISDLRPVERYIAPPDFIEQMARSCSIQYNSTHLTDSIASGELEMEHEHEPVVSTVPMPTLMGLVHWPNRPEFKFKSIWSVWVEIQTPTMELYQTIYFPDPAVPYYRVSITGNRVIMEYHMDPTASSFAGRTLKAHLTAALTTCFGIYGYTLAAPPTVKQQKYGKLLPIDNMERRKFILAMTDQYRIYSVGRFAIWRQILMDDVVHDVQMVENWIIDRSSYLRHAQR